MFPEDKVDLLCGELRAGRLVVLAGAGVSFAPPACAPVFRPLRDMLLKAFYRGIPSRFMSPVVANEIPALFLADSALNRGTEPVPEVLFESLSGPLGNRLFDVLRIILEVQYPNTQHLFIASLLGRGIKLLVTTNFEQGFELALSGKRQDFQVISDSNSIIGSVNGILGGKHSPTMWKIHGDLKKGYEHTISVTLGQVSREAHNTEKSDALFNVIRDLPLLVVGYSGYDADIKSTLIRAGQMGTEKLFWLALNEPEPGTPPAQVMGVWKERGHLLVGDLGSLLEELNKRLHASTLSKPSGDCEKPMQNRAQKLEDLIKHLPESHRVMCIASLAHKMSRYSSAISLMEILFAEAVRARNDNEVLGLQLLLFDMYMDSRNHSSAGEIVNRFYNILPILNRDIARMGINRNPTWMRIRGELLKRVARFVDEADSLPWGDELFKASIRDALEQKDYAFLMEVAVSYGIYLRHWNKPSEGLKYLEMAADWAKNLGDYDVEVKALENIALIQKQNREFGAAQRKFVEVTNIAKQTGNMRLLQESLYNLAEIYGNEGLVQAAKKVLDESFAIAEQLQLEEEMQQCSSYRESLKKNL